MAIPLDYNDPELSSCMCSFFCQWDPSNNIEFLGLCVPSLKYQIRHLSSKPFLFFSLNLWQWALARNQMRFLYFYQSNLETLLRLLSNALKCIRKQGKIFKFCSPVEDLSMFKYSLICRKHIEYYPHLRKKFLLSNMNSAVTGRRDTFLSL